MSETKTIQEEVREFVNALPHWQKILLEHTLSGNSDDPSVIRSAFKHLLFDSRLSTEAPEAKDVAIPDFFDGGAVGKQFSKLRLLELNDVENVNALRPKQRITFGPELTIIYGNNGSGKSGFARLMNNAFHSRGDKTILPNIFAPSGNNPPKGTFIFQDEGQVPSPISYPDGRLAPELRQFAVFDSKSIEVHLDEGNEIYVTPRELLVFGKLASLVQGVATLLDAEIEARTPRNNLATYFDGFSVVKTAIEGLDSKTNLEDVKKTASLSTVDITRVGELESELAKLKIQDAEARKKELLQIKETLAALRKQIGPINDHFSESVLDAIKQAVDRHKTLQKQAQSAGEIQFQDSRFSGIGSLAWKSFLSAAKVHSEQQANNGHEHPYPNDGDACLLCRQSLTSESIILIEKYWEFLSGEAERNIKASQDNLLKMSKAITLLNFSKVANDSAAFKWLSSGSADFCDDINSFFDSKKNEADCLATVLNTLEWTELAFSTAFDLDRFSAIEKKLEQDSVQLDADALKKVEVKLQQELDLLKHRQKLSDHLPAVVSYVETCRWIESAKDLRRRVITTSITKLQKDIHDELLTKKYTQLFHMECKSLDAPYLINMEQKGLAGKTKRHLSIEKRLPSEVLSEGEQRSIALADFFTEIQISGINGGVIFDDPVNSLDIERKKLIAHRLVEETKRRQVIIFTHDLSFVYDLKNAAKDMGVDICGHWVSKSKHTLEAGLVHLDCAPTSEKDFIDPTEAEEFLGNARKVDHPKEQIRHLKDGFESLRTTYEAFILTHLFGGAVSRFDRQINYAQFEKMTYAPRPHVEFVSKKLKHLSGFVGAHSHSDYAEGSQPSIDSLARELTEYRDFKKSFEAQRKTELQL